MDRNGGRGKTIDLTGGTDFHTYLTTLSFYTKHSVKIKIFDLPL